MIIATLKKEDGSFVGLIGVTARNVHNLVRGRPMLIDVKALEAGLEGSRLDKIMVVYEFSMRELADHLKKDGLMSEEQYNATISALDDGGEKRTDVISGGEIIGERN